MDKTKQMRMPPWSGDPYSVTEDHEARLKREAEKYATAFRELFELYGKLDAVLSRVPLKTVTGWEDHSSYLGLVRDVSLRAWREIESVNGPSQMTLAVIEGGKP
jgi:hypothetical protein